MNLPLPIGFLGAGNMAEALVGGIVARKLAAPGDVVISDVRQDRLELLAREHGVVAAASNADLVRRCKTVVFSVKPQNVRDVAAEIAADTKPGQLFITICAGVPARVFEERLTGAGGKARVVRVMPNTPALIGCGASALAPGAHATAEDLRGARGIFEAVGIAIDVREDQLDAVTGLTGSGPAYVFHLIEALIEAGAEQGLTAQDSEKMVKQMVLGAARLAMESPKTPADLRKAVTSPGGTTAAGLEVLSQGDFVGLVRRCVARATERSRELGRQA